MKFALCWESLGESRKAAKCDGKRGQIDRIPGHKGLGLIRSSSIARKEVINASMKLEVANSDLSVLGTALLSNFCGVIGKSGQ